MNELEGEGGLEPAFELEFGLSLLLASSLAVGVALVSDPDAARTSRFIYRFTARGVVYGLRALRGISEERGESRPIMILYEARRCLNRL